ncbi:MAG TPA: class I SAM-dependent methyltransferase [Burkholderiales bacterium]|nr:class I SAM-dependent methyltransferase [Burkholderiales bacterium]
MMMSDADVPSPIDLREMKDAKEWAETALLKRPCRTAFFGWFLKEMLSLGSGKVLELGSGPGFLARHVLERMPGLDYVALDFSPAMHELARERLGMLCGSVTFMERSFREAGWTEGLGLFDAVLTNQAVHELRHKRHAVRFHAEVRSVLSPGGCYLVCDPFAGEGGMGNADLYMSVEEQSSALRAAGFKEISRVHVEGGMVLHRAS